MKKKSNFSELMGFAGGHRALTYLSLALSVVSTALTLLPFVFIYLIIKEVINVAPNFSEAENIARYGWFAVIFALIAIAVYMSGLICSHLSAFRIAGNIRKSLLAHIAELPLGFVGKMGSGKIRRIVNDCSAATETYLAHQLPDMAGAIAAPLGMVVMLFAFDWRFGLACLAPMILGFAAMFKMAGPKMAEDMKKHQDALANMNNEAVEYIRGMPVVKTFGQTVHTLARFKGSIDSYCKFCISYCKKCRPPMLMYTLFVNSAFAFLITLALILTDGGEIARPTLMSLIFYVILTPAISTSMTKVMFTRQNGMIVRDALTRIHSILDRKPLSETTSPESPRDNSVELANVSFRYSDAKKDALCGVSLKVAAGETAALIGPSGGGKTTAAELISRFWDVTGGEIKIGGVNVKNIAKTDLSSAVSYVFQDSRLLKTSILENVRLARPDASREEVENALHRAQCDDIIAKLPNGVDTVIGTKGVFLSGGEQQRVAIARVMLKSSPIIILDEATAFADPENEALVQKAFEELSENKTVIMIAHRLTTVKNADKIFVIKDGKIEEAGTHEELVRKGGLYAKMWRDYQTSASWKAGAV